MEHWLDRSARALADGGLSRRQVVVGAARALIAGSVLGGGIDLGWHVSGAGGQSPCGLQVAPECANFAETAARIGQQACEQEAPADQRACLGANEVLRAQTLAQCLRDQGANGDCGDCEVCDEGNCISQCLLPCAPCAGGKCVDNCPPDEVCTRLGCEAKCPRPCAPYDPSTGGCRDKCSESNPCMYCAGDGCESSCPDPEYCQPDGTCGPCNSSRCQRLLKGHCKGCNSNCQKCEDGRCVDTCPEGSVCCAGRCLRCCNASCDEDEGSCTGDECGEGTTCCPSGCENLQSNDKHCGACDHACAKTEHCTDGMCITDCRWKGCPSAKYTCCNTTPNVYRCVDTTSDKANCGGCGQACDTPGYICCDSGCIDPMTDLGHCGGCGTSCVGNQETPYCVGGQCSPCQEGMFLCQGQYAPGGQNCCYTNANVCCEGGCCGAGYHCCPGSIEPCCPMGQGCCPQPYERCGC